MFGIVVFFQLVIKVAFFGADLNVLSCRTLEHIAREILASQPFTSVKLKAAVLSKDKTTEPMSVRRFVNQNRKLDMKFKHHTLFNKPVKFLHSQETLSMKS